MVCCSCSACFGVFRALAYSNNTTATTVITTVLLAVRHSPSAPPSPSAVYEQQYIRGVRPTRIRTHLHYYTNNSHIAGSAADWDTAVYTQQHMLRVGIPHVDIEQYQVLLSYP